MGRLTLNVLLSFAQFEREVTAERIRDKIAASKKKGMWMGGAVPLGYENRDKKLVVLLDVAETVRVIYGRYLALGSVRRLKEELDDRAKSGVAPGMASSTCPRKFSRGHLYWLLSNPVYAGDKPESHSQVIEDLVSGARVDFGVFVELFFPVLHQGKSLVYAPYIDVIIEVLSSSTQGGDRQIIINLPPGFMTSMLASILYVAWRLGINPAEKIICISYGDDLTHELSRKTRLLMQHPLYRKTFPGTVLDKKAEDSITTTRGGQR